MIKFECIYRKGLAGYLETHNTIWDSETKCQFMPCRSKAHLRLVELVKDNKKPVAIFKSEQHTKEAEILDMATDSITVREVRRHRKISFFGKLFHLLSRIGVKA